jgi:hypothetical protein
MTKAARRVLEDCKIALTELEADPTGATWRLRWAGTLTHLRAVGHVLDKVDGKTDPKAKQIINARYKEWKDPDRTEHAIFRDFIERERNNVIKEYDFGSGQGVIFEGGDPPAIQRQPDGTFKEIHPGGVGKMTSVYKMNTDPFKGEDPRDIVRRAIEWWQKQLDDIDNKVRASS